MIPVILFAIGIIVTYGMAFSVWIVRTLHRIDTNTAGLVIKQQEHEKRLADLERLFPRAVRPTTLTSD